MAVTEPWPLPKDSSAATEHQKCMPSLSVQNSRLKRTAEDALLSSPPSRKSRRGPPFLAPFTAIRRPEPLSINSIIREHCRDRLYISPLRWTSQHLRLLECEFVITEPCEKERRVYEQKSQLGNTENYAQDDAAGSECEAVELTEAVISMANALINPGLRTFKNGLVGWLLGKHEIHSSNSKLLFRFNQRIVTLKADGIFSYSPSGSATPSLAYLNLRDLRERRDMSVKICGKRGSLEVASLRQKLQRRLQPINEVEDPFIAAVLIALAQGQRQQQATGAETAEDASRAHISDTLKPFILESTKASCETVTCFKVHVLVYPTEGRSLYFYTARISSEFLNKFERPSRYFRSEPVRISYYRIPLTAAKKLLKTMECVISEMRNEVL